MIDDRHRSRIVYHKDARKPSIFANLDWNEFEDIDLDKREADNESKSLQSTRSRGTFATFDDLVDAQGRLRTLRANATNEAPTETKSTGLPNSLWTVFSPEKASDKTRHNMGNASKPAAVIQHHIAPLEEENLDGSEIVRTDFADAIWTKYPNLELAFSLPNPLPMDGGNISIPEIIVTPPTPGSPTVISSIPNIYIHPPADNGVSQTCIAETFRTQKKWPDVRRLCAWPKTSLRNHILLELRWRELERWQSENRTEAFKLTQELNCELGKFVDDTIQSIEIREIRDLNILYADAQWALTHLLRIIPESNNLRRLSDILLMLSEHAHSPAKQIVKNEAEVARLDPVWDLQWRAEVLPGNVGPKINSCHLLSIAELCDMDVAFPLPYSSFHLRQSQAKFKAWSENAVANPNDQDYSMLTYAQKITLTVLENQIKAVAEIERSRDCYLDLLKLGGSCSEQMEGFCEKTLTQAKAPQTPTVVAGFQLGSITKQIIAMYQTCQALSDAKRDRNSTRSSLSKMRKELSNHRLFCQSKKARVFPHSSSSVHALHTRQIVGLFWKTAYSARQEIFVAHGPYRQCLERCSDMERLLWLAWINGMYREALVVRKFKEKIHLDLLPSVNDFVYETLVWWEAKLDEAALGGSF